MKHLISKMDWAYTTCDLPEGNILIPHHKSRIPERYTWRWRERDRGHREPEDHIAFREPQPIFPPDLITKGIDSIVDVSPRENWARANVSPWRACALGGRVSVCSFIHSFNVVVVVIVVDGLFSFHLLLGVHPPLPTLPSVFIFR